ncbi:ankyrin [Xylona heveae TC161]|uniref:Ankyrin n=1 Tax=Xylona heveae (strain CBS 132557 / TC161) TaxID=1328760 RepID=A0A165I4S1_XYLHT|nr:ankyrin [Xylona heveae TC161]KZF24380.1 ankyrin [Xylona heveae TC161]
MAQQSLVTTNSRNLWQEAFGSLSQNDQAHLQFDDQNIAIIPSQMLNYVKDKKQECLNKRWVFRKRNQDEVMIRDIFEKIARWINKFKEIGDVVIQYDPGHAALPWAGVRFLLQLALNDVQVYGTMLEGIEIVSRVITQYAEIEKNNLRETSTTGSILQDALVKIYKTALLFLVKARQYFESSTGKRIAKSTIQIPKSSVIKLLDDLEKEEETVHRILASTQTNHHTNVLTSIAANVADIKAGQVDIIDRKDRTRILKQLRPVYTNDHYHKILEAIHYGTSNWIFNREEFIDFAELDLVASKVFWIHGPPGFGKTFLAARIIQSLRAERSNLVAYFFCQYEEDSKREPQAILRSFLAQILNQSKEALKVVREPLKVAREPCDDYHEGFVFTLEEQWRLFRKFCQRIKQCVFIIDGFDECWEFDRTMRYSAGADRSNFLRNLIKEISKSNSRLLLLSRDHADIRTEIFNPRTDGQNVLIFDYEISAKDTIGDVITVSRNLVDSKLPRKSEEDRIFISHQAAQKSEGMLLWVHLLSQRLDPSSNAKEIRGSITQMPPGFEEAYERELLRVSKLSTIKRARTIKMIRLILFALRPLTVRELIEASVVDLDSDENTYPMEHLPDEWKLYSVSDDDVTYIIREPLGSLIEIRSDGEQKDLSLHTVHFVHFSVKEYLHDRNRAGDSQNQELCFRDLALENEHLARLCLKYLCCNVFGNEAEIRCLSLKEMIMKYPFLAYAALYWYQHTPDSNKLMPETLKLVGKLLNNNTKNWKTWAVIYETGDTILEMALADDISPELSNLRVRETGPSPFYYACYLGFLDIVKELHTRGFDLNEKGGYYGFPLQASLSQAHFSTAKYLIENGATFEQEDNDYISAAFIAGLDNITEDSPYLRECSTMIQASLSRTKRLKSTAHHSKIHEACFRAIKILQMYNIGPGSRAAHEIVSLILNATCCKRDIDQVLLNFRQGLNEEYIGAYCLARFGERDRRTLLESLSVIVQGIDSRNDYDQIPLFGAIQHRQIKSVDLLISCGADVNHTSDEGTPLLAAIELGELELVSLLAAHGADLDLSSVHSGTPLCEAVLDRKLHIVWFLLEHGANPLKSDQSGTTPLDIAFSLKDKELAMLLLHYNALPIANPYLGMKPPGLEETERDADVLGRELQIAICVDDSSRTQCLLKAALTHSMAEIVLGSALIVAVAVGSTEVKNLLENKANIHFKSPNGRTPLHYATMSGNVVLAELLIRYGAHAWEEDDFQHTAFDLVSPGSGESTSAMLQLLVHSFDHVSLFNSLPNTLFRVRNDAWNEMAGTWELSAWEMPFSISELPFNTVFERGVKITFDINKSTNNKTLAQFPFFSGVERKSVLPMYHQREIYGQILNNEIVLLVSPFERMMVGEFDKSSFTIRGEYRPEPYACPGYFTMRKLTDTILPEVEYFLGDNMED